MLNFVVSFTFALMLIAASPVDAWTTKKKYAEYIESLPPEGDKPSAEYVKRAVNAYFKYSLKDPDSANYEWGAIELGTWKGAFEKYGTPGWIADVQVNAKNSYGAYIGYKPYKFIFRSGSIVEIYQYENRHQDWFPNIGVKGKPIPPLPTSDTIQKNGTS